MKYPAYPKYKPSGVEWLGEVPEHWEVKRSRFCMNINPRSNRLRKLEPDEEVSFVPMEAIGEYGGLNLEVAKPLGEIGTSYTEFEDGDVIVAKITPCFENGKGAIAEGLTNGVALGTTELHVLRVLAGLDRRFLFYITISSAYRKTGVAEMYGAGGQKRVPPEFSRNFRLTLPPLPEQRAIADFLDRETAKLDTLVAKKRELLEKLKEKRTALISRTVTRGLPPEAARAAGFDPHPKLKPSGIEWLGEVPEHWVVKKIRHLVLLKSGENITSEELEDDGEFPVFGGNGIRGYSSTFSHDGHYVLIGRQGALCGNINYAKGKFWASEHAVVVSPLKELATVWLGELLRAMDLNQYSISAAQPGLSVEMINKLKIPVPPLSEQRALAGYLDRETAKIDQMAAKVEEAIARLQEYRTALITAAVTGKIEVKEAGSCER